LFALTSLRISWAMQLYEEAGFTNIRMVSEFSQVPASQEDTLFSILGARP